MVELNDTVVTGARLLSTEIDGEIVMMDVESGKYYNLDPIGSEIWAAMAKPVAVASLCAEMAARYDATPDVIQTDILSLLDQLADKRLIRVNE